LSGLQAGSFRPSIENTVTSTTFIATTTQWLSEFLLFLRTQGLHDITVAALVTGSIRAAWERSGPKNRSLLETTVSDVLHAVCPKIVTATGTESFFLTQTAEGTFEYDALTTVVNTESGSMPARLLLGIGIGRGSTQLPYRTLEGGVCVATLVTQGMQNPDLSVDMLQKGVTEWRGPTGRLLLEDFTTNVRHTIDTGDIPVIALKSGALIAYSDKTRQVAGD
jgi:hypothetical protein